MNVSHCDLKARGNETAVFDNSVAWINDSFYSAGILGFGLYLLLGITSLPSVSNALSWREFSFIQVDPGVRVQHMLAFGRLGAWPNGVQRSASSRRAAVHAVYRLSQLGECKYPRSCGQNDWSTWHIRLPLFMLN